MSKPKNEAIEFKGTGGQLYELCYMSRDISAELKSLGMLLGNMYATGCEIDPEDLTGLEIMLKRLAENAATVAKRLDEIAAPLPR